jgi:hypothetical protein
VTTTYDATATAPELVVRRIVELAGRAPSFHNTQPWRWAYAGGVLELHADRSRQQAAEDPDGRNLVISCGAALQHADAAAGALGWHAEIDRLPDGPDSALLARLRLVPAAVHRHAQETVEAIEQRCTDRRRFTSWPIPEERLGHLAAVATQWGTHGLALVDVTDRFRVELLVARALGRQSSNPEVAAEQASWIEHGDADGIPSAAVPAPAELLVRRPSRFATGLLDDSTQDVEGTDGLIVLCDADDDPMAWLKAGEGLSALWLAATTGGLSVVPLSQVIEVDETRAALQHEVLGGLARPLILLRVGWQPISRSELARTPRRATDEILDLAAETASS